MFKKILLVFIVSMFVFGNSKLFAQENNQKKVVAAEKALSEEVKVVNVGNTICPVSGEKIKEETKATYEYEGKIYNLCCSMCIDEFKKDPAKYVKKVEEELQNKDKETGK